MRCVETVPLRARLSVWLVVATALLMVGSACSGTDDPLDEAIAIADDAGEFGNGPEAGESLARIAQHLGRAIDGCDADEEAIRCDSLRVASGYAQVLAVQVLQCTAPGRFEARTGMLELLREVDAVEPEDSSTPEPPALPDCS